MYPCASPTDSSQDVTVSKRPLMRPAIPSPYSGSATQKVVYISSRTPFMSAVKRVQKLLSQVEKRATQSAATETRNSKKRKFGATEDDMGDITQIAAKLAEDKSGDKDEVVMKATGKAIEKALNMALWFQQREEFGIRIKTGSVGAIDDIVPAEEEPDDAEETRKDGDAQMKDANVDDEEKDITQDEDIPETRIRYASTIEVAVFMK